MKRPKKTPDRKMGDKTLGDMINYYNDELMIEARKIVEYKAYIDGTLDSIKKSGDVSQVDFIKKETDYYGERLEFLTTKMQAVRKVLQMLGANLD